LMMGSPTVCSWSHAVSQQEADSRLQEESPQLYAGDPETERVRPYTAGGVGAPGGLRDVSLCITGSL
jgi:hypothetical protein